jgi:hypothetical protein
MLHTFFISVWSVAEGSNILVFHNLGTKSHLHMVFPIVEGLLGETVFLLPKHVIASSAIS